MGLSVLRIRAGGGGRDGCRMEGRREDRQSRFAAMKVMHSDVSTVFCGLVYYSRVLP